MSDAAAGRILTYAALFAGGSVLAIPSIGMNIGVVAGAAAIASVFGNTLANDVHTAFTADSLDPLTSRHLRQLVGNALAALIECYVAQNAPAHVAGRLARILHRSDAGLSALAKAAKKHWCDLQVAGEKAEILNGNIHKAFLEGDALQGEPLVSSAEWDRRLAEIAVLARSAYDDPVWLADERRRSLAEYIAPRFFGAIQELVKADLDPSIGTGGRVFVALHLNLMRTLSTSLRGIEVKSEDVSKQVGFLQTKFDEIATLVVSSLSPAQKIEIFDLLSDIRREQAHTRSLLVAGFDDQSKRHSELVTQLKAIAAEITNRHAADQLGAEPLDHLIAALKRLAESGESGSAAVKKLSEGGRYEEATEEAFKLAQSEMTVATHLGNAARKTRSQAFTRWLDAGDVAFASDLNKAREAYQNCVELDSTNPFGWARLGQVQWLRGEYADSLAAFTNLWHGLPERGLALFKATSSDAAVEELERFTREHPEIPKSVYLWIVRSIVHAGLFITEILAREPVLVTQWVFKLLPVNEPNAVARMPTVDEASTISRFIVEWVYNLAGLLGKDGGPSEHRRILEHLSNVALHRGELDASDGYLRRARDMSIHLRDFVAEAGHLSNLGIIAAERGEVNTARAYLEEALAICKGNAREARLIVGKQLISKAEVERLRREHEARIAAGIPEREVGEDEIEVCNRLADEFVQNPESAMHKALRLKEVEGSAHGNLGLLAMQCGDLEQARRDYDIALRLHESIGFDEGASRTRKALARLA